jgi:ABC-type nitrate/sulfonate/bicarbonate transport system substrate-binding protein
MSRRLLMCAAAGLAFVSDGNRANGQELGVVRIGTPSASLASSGLRIADSMGLFKNHGLRAEFVRLDNGSVATAALVSGSVDFALSGAGDLIAAQMGGQPVVAIANQYRGFGIYLVLSKPAAEALHVPPEAPASERIQALNGLLIAGASPTFIGTLAMKATALAAGVTVRFTYMVQDNMPSALDSGTIQGFLGATPAWAVPVLRGTGVLWLSGPAGDFPTETSPGTSSLLLSRRDFAQSHTSLVDAMRSILADFGRKVAENPDEVKAAIARVYPTLDPQIIAMYFKNESAAWDAKPFTAKEMAREIRFLRNSGAAPAAALDRLDAAAMVYG